MTTELARPPEVVNLRALHQQFRRESLAHLMAARPDVRPVYAPLALAYDLAVMSA